MVMTSTDHTLLVVLVVLMSLFFLLLTIVMVGAVQVVLAVKRVVRKGEEVMETVEGAAEDAADMLRDNKGRVSFFRTVRNIIKFAEKGRKK